MEKRVLLLAILVLVISTCFTACDKKPHIISRQEPVDTATVKLKELVVGSLPSPHYKFEYNQQGFVTSLTYSSGLVIYDVEYANGRVKKMTERNTGDYLLYTYSGSLVSSIDVHSGSGGRREWHHEFTYDQHKKLIKAEWFIFPGGGTVPLPERKMEFLYRADGNLASYNDYFPEPDGQYKDFTVVTFDNYDDKINVDDFDLLNYHFGHVLYLPGVRLQKNNPRARHRENANNEFEITYSYDYTDRLPREKTTTVKKLRGDNSGTMSVTKTTYTYY